MRGRAMTGGAWTGRVVLAAGRAAGAPGAVAP